MSEHQNLFIVFPQDAGGNHLANILSLSSPYVARCSPDAYDANQSTAHYSDMNNVDYKIIKNNLKKFVDQNNVFCGHWLEFMQLREEHLYECFPNRTVIVIQIPNYPGLAFDRMFNAPGGTEYKYYPWLAHEAGLLYQCNSVRLLLQEPQETKFYYVWPNFLFDDDVGSVLKHLHSQGFDVKLDISIAQAMHAKWINNIKVGLQQ